MSFNSRTQLTIVNGNLTGQRYRDKILAPVVVPHFNVNRNVTIFQQDNARCHTARVSVDYLQQQNIDWLPWPARSPDLSPIEHLWDALDRRVRQRQPQTLGDLRNFLVEEWNRTPQQQIGTLINSMRRRCLAVRDANGGYTNYWLFVILVNIPQSYKTWRWRQFFLNQTEQFLHEIISD